MLLELLDLSGLGALSVPVSGCPLLLRKPVNTFFF